MIPITGNTKTTCLLGHPVSHSMSPALHNTAFEALGLDIRYLAYDVTPEGLVDAVEGLRALGVVGFNITMPHKAAILPLCDTLSPQATRIGAVNTVVHRDGKLHGHNTDGIGYLRAAENAGVGLQGEKMTILGAGGTAAAILVAAAYEGVAAIDVFTTRPEVANTLTDTLTKETGCRIRLFQQGDRQALAHSLSDSKLLVNGTPVGMAPNVEGCLVPADFSFPSHLVVSDVIYHPQKTALLQLAESQGLATFNGLYMLLYQADEAFFLWTGQRMPIALLKERYYTPQCPQQ